MGHVSKERKGAQRGRRRPYLHAVIVLIGHNHPPLAVARYAGGAVKLTGPGPQRAKLMVEGTARLEYLRVDTGSRLARNKETEGRRRKGGILPLHLNAVVAAIGHHHVSFPVHTHSPGPTQLAISFPFAPKR